MKTIKPAHAPTPWHIAPNWKHGEAGYRSAIAKDPNGHGWFIAMVCNCAEAEANAELIVRAVNTHAELIERHEAILNYASDALCHINCDHPAFNYVKAIHNEAKRALSK